MGEYIYWIGLVAVASAAASGALEAGRKPAIDLFGGIVVGLAAATLAYLVALNLRQTTNKLNDCRVPVQMRMTYPKKV